MAESQGALSNISQISTMATTESQSVKRKLRYAVPNLLEPTGYSIFDNNRLGIDSVRLHCKYAKPLGCTGDVDDVHTSSPHT